MMRPLMLVHFGCSAFMAGIVWYAQLVHYPLFATVGGSSFLAYQRRNIFRSICLVAPVMIVEAVTALWLLWRLHTLIAIAGAAILLGIWALTAVHWAQHRSLAQSFSDQGHHRLLTLHWLRVFAWTARLILAGMMAA